jgi:hypothetical protein
MKIFKALPFILFVVSVASQKDADYGKNFKMKLISINLKHYLILLNLVKQEFFYLKEKTG